MKGRLQAKGAAVPEGCHSLAGLATELNVSSIRPEPQGVLSR